MYMPIPSIPSQVAQTFSAFEHVKCRYSVLRPLLEQHAPEPSDLSKLQ